MARPKSVKSGATERNSPDAPDLKEKWDSQNDFKYVVEAIGRIPHSPPLWAMEICIREAALADRNARTGNDKTRYGRILDEMFRVLWTLPDDLDCQKPPLATLIEQAIVRLRERGELNDDNPELRRNVRTQWQKELEQEDDVDSGPEGIPWTRRGKDILHEIQEGISGKPMSRFSEFIYRHEHAKTRGEPTN